MLHGKPLWKAVLRADILATLTFTFWFCPLSHGWNHTMQAKAQPCTLHVPMLTWLAGAGKTHFLLRKKMVHFPHPSLSAHQFLTPKAWYSRSNSNKPSSCFFSSFRREEYRDASQEANQPPHLNPPLLCSHQTLSTDKEGGREPCILVHWHQKWKGFIWKTPTYSQSSLSEVFTLLWWQLLLGFKTAVQHTTWLGLTINCCN